MPIDWIQSLDPGRAVGNLQTEMTGDWHRDPWGWPEYEYLLNGQLDRLATRAKASGLRRVVQIDVPKSNFGIRPAVILEPVDRLLYQGLVDCLSKKMIGGLSPWVHGWRLNRSQPRPGVLSSNEYEWKQYRGHLKFASLFCDFGLRSDIVSCFASIPIERLCEDVERNAGNSDVTHRLTNMLLAFNDVQGRAGLAQRSVASAVLANMYLDRLRYVLDDYAKSNDVGIISQFGGTLVLRWMDDLWAFGDDEAKLRALQVDLQDVAREAGLELNLGKTDLLSEEGLYEAAMEIEHSAVDAAIDAEPSDLVPLEHLLDKIIEAPEASDRTTVRFAMTRMRRQRVTSRLSRLVEVAPRMPHGADHLGRAFRDFGIWETHQDWYMEYADSPWGRITWSVAQMGTMFPTKSRPTDALMERFGQFLASRSQFSLLALSAQRLAAWRPVLARDHLRELAKVADHPQERRIIALAAATAGEEKTFIRQVLSEYEENRITLDLLEARGFKPVDPAPDFGSD